MANMVISLKKGKATGRQMEQARKLTADLMAEIGKKRVADTFGLATPTVYSWKLIPPQHAIAFSHKFGVKLEAIRPDMVRI